MFEPINVAHVCRPNDSTSPISHQHIIRIIQPIADIAVASIRNFLALFKFFQQSEVARHCRQNVLLSKAEKVNVEGSLHRYSCLLLLMSALMQGPRTLAHDYRELRPFPRR